MKMVHLDELAMATTSEGGIRVTYTGQNRDLLLNGGLEDQSVGYSVALPLAPAPMDSTVSKATVAELGLMTGPADPMMWFPAGIVFTPYTVVRNTSDKPLAATPTLWWMAGGVAQSFQLPAIKLLPSQSQTLKIPALLSAAGLKNFAGTVHLVFDVPENADGFFLAGGSVDQTSNYVFSITPHGITESAARTLSYWSTGNGDDTMVTLWNPADEAQDFLFQLNFTGGHYQFPIHLEPRATRIFNISEIGQIPDDEGNIIPAGIHEGSAKISGTEGDYENILVAMDAGTYNVRKATCFQFCHGCFGVTSYSVSPSSFAIATGSQQQLTFIANWTNGNQTSESGSWSTSNSSLASVGSGLVTGVGSGSVTITAQTNGTPDPDGFVTPECEPFKWTCPLDYIGGSASSSGNVTQAIPTNFIASPGAQLNTGALFFTYSWSSSSGKLADLSTCTGGESVFYPGSTSPYIWPLPMVQSTFNPEVNKGPASGGGFEDTNSPPNSFQQPYSSAGFNATQRIWWSCPYWNSGNLNYFVPDITIARSVFKDTDGFWKYTITKSGATNTIKLPNQ